MKSFLLALFFVALFLVPHSCAEQNLQNSMPLLALTESGDKMTGTVANLLLELRPGSERVFLETYPLTKMSTQASLRFAQQIACNELEIDCSTKDFLYKIDALPGIVGGPSAGAAAAVLTGAMLAGVNLRNDSVITGTINSGGLIGSVGGLKEKISAASSAGFAYVLIPKGTAGLGKTDDNASTNLVEFGKRMNVSVIEVATFGEAFEWFTGKKIPYEEAEVVVEPKYEETMRKIATTICHRTEKIRKEINNSGLSELLLNKTNEAKNNTLRAKDAFDKKDYYSSASYCFRANVLLNEVLLRTLNHSRDDYFEIVARLNSSIVAARKKLETISITTLNDLQTYMAVDERLFEASKELDRVAELLENATNETSIEAGIAYVDERINSALAWSYFFKVEDYSREFVVDENALARSCLSKISEAEERYSYLESIASFSVPRTALENAYAEMNKKYYIPCIYRAAKAKADYDVVLSAAGINESDLAELVALKLNASARAISKAQKKGVFPIIGYSYYEYARSLKGTDDSSALLFSEYALELSGLDIYFEKKPAVSPQRTKLFSFGKNAVFFLLGLATGIILFRLFWRARSVQDSQRKKAPRRKRY